MTKSEVVTKISEMTGVDKVDVLVVLESFFQEVKNSVKSGEEINIRGFGTFGPKKRKKRVARNIDKNVLIEIPPHYVPEFRPSRSFNEGVKKNTPKIENNE